MSISTTSFYGLGRDFLSMIPMGYNAFTAAKGKPAKSRADLVLRVNPHSPICEPSGFAAHKAEIRKELAAL